MKMQDVLTFNLRRLRKERGLTQGQLADLCESTITFIQHIETQRRWPHKSSIEIICKALGIEEHELFQIPQEEKKEPPKDETLDQIKALLAEKKPDLSHIPKEFSDLAKNLPKDHKSGWDGMLRQLQFEIDEYQLELKEGPRKFLTKEEYLKQKAEKEAFMMPSSQDNPDSKKA